MRPGALAAMLVAAGVAVAGPGCHHGRPPLHPESPPGTWYVLQPGESLADVARRTGTPLEDILELNGIAKGERVAPGRVVYVVDRAWLAGAGAGASTPSGNAQAARSPSVSPARGASQAPVRGGSLRWPVEGAMLTSPFGVRGSRPHEGIDLAAPTGTPVHAAEAGEVVYAGDGIRGYGNLVVVQHAGGLLTVYAHNSVLSVKQGERVAAGQVIAQVGQTGRATAPHLHFEVRDGQIPRDPMRYLKAP